MNKINSKEYWETRFKEDWEINKGREQTKFFAKLMVDNLPKTLKSIIKKEKLSIMDWGCGEGDSLEIIHKEFAESKLIGLDISKNAIIKAKEYHPSFEFTTKTLSELNKQQDIIFSSNCLEHFNNPNTILNKLTEFSKDYLILVLPFQEYKKHIEHLVTFDYDSIKVTANDMFLIYHKEIDASELNQTFWEGKQILLIYARSESKGVRDLDIKIEDTIQSIKLDIISKNDEKINNITTAKDKEINKIIAQKEIEITKLSEKSQSEINKLIIEKEDIERRLIEKSAELERIYNSKRWKIISPIADTANKFKQGSRKVMGRILPYSVKTAIKEMIENEKSINNTDFEFNEKLNEPKVSIILPIYNQANYLDEAIQGVLNQTYQKFELIIVNDGSTDNVEKIFDKYKEYKKVILLTQKNQKLPSALNNGFHFASGDYFTWTSADNIMLPNQIEKLVEYLNKNPDKGMVYSDYQAIDDKGKPLNDPNFRPHNQDRKDPSIIRLPDEVTELNFHDSGDNFIGASFMYRKEVAYVIGKYDTETFGGEDYDYWLRIHNLFSIGHIKDVLYRYRVHENTLNAKAKELRLFENIRKLLEKDKKRREFLKTTLEIVESESEKIETHKRNANIKVAIYKYSNIKKLSTIGADSNSLNLRICELDVDITDVDLQILDEYDLITTTDNKAYFYLCDKLKSKLIRIDSKKDRELFCKIVKNKVFDKMYVIQDMKDLPSPYRNRKVNLAIQVESMDKGGLEEVVCGIIRNISKEIFNVYLIVNDNKLGYLGEKIKEEGYNVVIIDNNRDLLLHTIKNNKIDIVNLHYSIFGIQEYKRNGIGIIYTIHNSYTWLSEQQIKQRKLAYKEVNHFIAVSNQVRDFFANKFNVRYSEIATISNGFDANEFKNVKGYNREHFGIAKDDFVFIDVASFNGNKFQNVIVSAMKELKKEFPSFKVILVGNTSDEKYYKFILRLIRKNGLKENIKIIDFKPKCELGSLLKAANCFILPSIQEGWSCAIMEAMYFELPLILSEIGSAKDVIRNKDIGIIIRNPYKSIYTLTMKEKNDLFYDEKPNNTKDLKGAMIDIYKNYKEWKVKSKKGKEKVLNEFNIKSMIKNYETEYTATNYIYKKVK